MARAGVNPTSVAETGKRLARTRTALGYTTTKMCKLMGSSSHGSAFTNYEMGRRRISLDHALALCDECGLTLDWIYRGHIQGLPEHLQKAIQALAG